MRDPPIQLYYSYSKNTETLKLFLFYAKNINVNKKTKLYR